MAIEMVNNRILTAMRHCFKVLIMNNDYDNNDGSKIYLNYIIMIMKRCHKLLSQ